VIAEHCRRIHAWSSYSTTHRNVTRVQELRCSSTKSEYRRSSNEAATTTAAVTAAAQTDQETDGQTNGRTDWRTDRRTTRQTDILVSPFQDQILSASFFQHSANKCDGAFEELQLTVCMDVYEGWQI